MKKNMVLIPCFGGNYHVKKTGNFIHDKLIIYKNYVW